jgi:hypothetical protein
MVVQVDIAFGLVGNMTPIVPTHNAIPNRGELGIKGFLDKVSNFPLSSVAFERRDSG